MNRINLLLSALKEHTPVYFSSSVSIHPSIHPSFLPLFLPSIHLSMMPTGDSVALRDSTEPQPPGIVALWNSKTPLLAICLPPSSLPFRSPWTALILEHQYGHTVLPPSPLALRLQFTCLSFFVNLVIWHEMGRNKGKRHTEEPWPSSLSSPFVSPSCVSSKVTQINKTSSPPRSHHTHTHTQCHAR